MGTRGTRAKGIAALSITALAISSGATAMSNAESAKASFKQSFDKVEVSYHGAAFIKGNLSKGSAKVVFVRNPDNSVTETEKDADGKTIVEWTPSAANLGSDTGRFTSVTDKNAVFVISGAPDVRVTFVLGSQNDVHATSDVP